MHVEGDSVQIADEPLSPGGLQPPSGDETDWLVINKDEAGKGYVPWDEIDVRLVLARQVA